ncbi:MAG: helix-turn-helix domain-containing protein [Chitinispirillales bacterium]|jgi:hypothetical protein|nr:helix-turn-helix domain-containing protein [Chitinispirillales bacterium]
MRVNDIFKKELELAQSGDRQAIERILHEFDPLIRKYQYIKNKPDDDLLSKLRLAAYQCILRFRADEDDFNVFLKEAKNILPDEDAFSPENYLK